MAIEDKTLVCKDCGKNFTWTAGEQKFFQNKKLQNIPARCPECRKVARDNRKSKNMSYDIACSECDAPGSVSRLPSLAKTILCEDCFAKKQAKAEEEL